VVLGLVNEALLVGNIYGRLHGSMLLLLVQPKKLIGRLRL
jgi:hypothetical protein